MDYFSKIATFVTPINEVVMLRRVIHNHILPLIALLCYSAVSAQQLDEYDFRNYKFYDEEFSEPLYPIADTIRPNAAYEDLDDPLAQIRYSLTTLGNPRRGGGYDEERYCVDNLDIEYSTARLLGSTGIGRATGSGTGYAPSGGGTATLTHYTLATDASRCYEQHYLRGEFSGKRYIGGVSYAATFTPHRHPARTDDWYTRVYARARAGRDIYVEGVYAYAADIAATLGRVRRNSAIGIALLLPVGERGLNRASVEEAYTLTANRHYNPTWGIQDGKVRNSRIERTLRPEAIVSWQQRLTATTTLHLGANLYYALEGNSALAWFDAMTPEPDNYRYLPSYQSDATAQREVEEAWLTNDLRYTQLDWEAMYHTNAIQSDGRAAYIVESRRSNTLHTALNALLESNIQSITLRYGIDAAWHRSHEFKVAEDLLGADHIEDIDYHLIDDNTYSSNTRNNLRSVDTRITEGERYGYNYALTRRHIALQGIVEWHNEQMSASAALRISGEQTLRRGYFEKELFAGNGSYGRSAIVTLAPYRFDARWSYTFGRHSLRAGAMMRGKSPEAENLFLQREYNNRTVATPSLCHTAAADVTYSYSASRLSLSATAFCNYSFDDSEVLHYYDDLAQEYADVVISAIDRLNLGVELVADVRYSRCFSSTFALIATLSRYTDDAEMEIYADKDNRLLASTSSLMRGCRGNTPALTLYGDVEYRSANGWSASLAATYWGMRYVDPAFAHRSVRVLSYASSPEERAMLTTQERLPDGVMIDIGGGKSFKFRTGQRLYLHLALRNILGSETISRGYEQNRVSRQTIGGVQHVTPFANRLSYAYPRTIYLSVGVSF